MNGLRLVIHMFCLSLLCSCNFNKVNKYLTNIASAPIVIPDNLKITLNGLDITDYDLFKSRLKMIIYSDSTNCSSCDIRLFSVWKEFIAKTNKDKLKFYFVFSPPSHNNIRLLLKNANIDYPVLIDSLGEFERLNPHLPKNKAMHTFLLDENNNVVLVGNPLHNPKIEKMFKEIVEEKLGKKE